MIQARKSGHRLDLNRCDLMVFEQLLTKAVSAFFPFAGHSLLFPRTPATPAPVWFREEQKLLLPLTHAQGVLLGVFVATGVPHKPAPGLLSHWPSISALIIENLLLYKRSLCDPVTGLFSRHYLLSCMGKAIETLRDPIRQAWPVPGAAVTPVALASGEGEPPRGGMGLLVVRSTALRDVVREFGYQFADELTIALADALVQVCPEQALAARTGDSEFAVYLPAAGARVCQTLAGNIAQTLGKVRLLHPLRKEQVGIEISVGYSLYPQDMSGQCFIRPSVDQARLALRKARLASALAGEDPEKGGRPGVDTVMGFSRILSEGGRVLEALPFSRVLVSLGFSAHAREGQRFAVWSASFPASGGIANGHPALSPLYKGELVLMEVHDTVSQAEIIHLGEPGWDIGPGDRLTLLPEEQGGLARGHKGALRMDAATGFLRHGDFLARWGEECEKYDGFALALVRFAVKDRSWPLSGPETLEDEASAYRTSADNSGLEDAHPDRIIADVARLCLEELGTSVLGGRYSLNSFIFFHPGSDFASEKLKKHYFKLAQEVKKIQGLEMAVGISKYPHLNFRKADTLENSRKALEYAMLLPWPHVGVLDSLALNISADKQFSQGYIFGAIREYQLALLADEKNSIAWNSLGICLAGLNRHAEAEHHFARALACDPDDAMALYNLGYTHQSQGRVDEARKQYLNCLKLAPAHLYALVRLGQLAENEKNSEAARALYEQAALLPDGKSLTYRHFARLSISEGKPDEAREHLHEALLHNPQDAFSMTLLAGLYLDAGEDPEMAATLARQSVSLRPELKAGWLQLARAMQATGREREAREARLKAGVG